MKRKNLPRVYLIALIIVAVAENILPRKQYPTLDGIKMILDSLAEKEPKAKAAKPQDFAEVRFIKELDDSGFIDKLYGSK